MKRCVGMLVAALVASGLVFVSAPAQAAGPQPAACNRPTAPGFSHCLAELEPWTAPAVAPRLAGSKSSSYTPADLQSLYGVTAGALSQAAGTTVALVDAGHDARIGTTLATYRDTFGLPACTAGTGCFREVNQRGSTDFTGVDDASTTGWDTEIALDVEAVSAVCPTCHILLVDADSADNTDLMTAVRQAVAQGASYVSMSWGGSELANESYQDSIFTPGVTFVASTGDEGYSHPAADPLSGLLCAAAPVLNLLGLGSCTTYPASSPNVVAVGGTSVRLVSGTWQQSAWSGSTSGCSLFERSAGPATGNAAVTSACGAQRATADVSALADPSTGMLGVLDDGGQYLLGGTSLAAPLIAGLYAIAGNHTDPFNVYRTAAQSPATLADVVSGSTEGCSVALVPLLCQAAAGWDGATGLGSPVTPVALASTVPVGWTPPPGTGQGPDQLPVPTLPTLPKRVAVVLRGRALVGHRVSAAALRVPAGAQVSFQWLLDGHRLRGASGSSLRVTRAMRHHQLAVVAVVRVPGRAAASYLSAPARVR